MKMSLQWYPKATQFFSHAFCKCVWLNRWETTLAFSLSFYADDVSKYVSKAGTKKQGKMCLKKGPLPATVQCASGRFDDRGKQQEGSCQSRCAGVGNALKGLNDGLSHSVFWAAVPGAVADAIIWLHTTCLWGFNHKRRTAGGFTGRKHKLYYTETHRVAYAALHLTES